MVRWISVAILIAACGGERPARPPSRAREVARAPGTEAPVAITPPAAIPGRAPEPARAAITVAPREIDFGFVPYGDAYEKAIRIESTGSAPAHVEGFRLAEGSSDRYALAAPASADLLPGEVRDVTVVFTPEAPSVETEEAHLLFETAQAAYDVPIAGFGSAPCLKVDPDPLEFGRTPDGYVPVAGFDLTNCGAEPIALESLTLEGACASVEDGMPGRWPFILPAGSLVSIALIIDQAMCDEPCSLVLTFANDRLAPRTVPVHVACLP